MQSCIEYSKFSTQQCNAVTTPNIFLRYSKQRSSIQLCVWKYLGSDGFFNYLAAKDRSSFRSIRSAIDRSHISPVRSISVRSSILTVTCQTIFDRRCLFWSSCCFFSQLFCVFWPSNTNIHQHKHVNHFCWRLMHSSYFLLSSEFWLIGFDISKGAWLPVSLYCA